MGKPMLGIGQFGGGGGLARDANSNLSANNFLEGFTTTVTGGVTTTLTVASTHIQEFTGVVTQSVKLPVVSTLALGQSFYIINNTTDVLTVQSSGVNTVKVVLSGDAVVFTCVKITGTDASSWDFPVLPAAGGGAGNETYESSQNDLALTDATIQMQMIRTSGGGAIDITGLVAEAGGAKHIFCNRGSDDITFKHDSVSSSAVNRFTCNTDADIVCVANTGIVEVWYDSVINTWRAR